MNWWQWWISQNLISGLLWIVLSPPLGRALLKLLVSEEVQDRGRYDFIIGFGVLGTIATLFVPFHRYGLPLLFVFLVFVMISNPKRSSRRDWSQLGFTVLAAAPILVASFLYPTAIDSHMGGAQFSAFHDLWPMDWTMRLDTQLSLPFLFAPWFEKVPLLNSLSVQSVFFAILAWKTLDLCLEIGLKRKATSLEKIFLLVFFFGSVFFRRQIYVKASPIGGLYALLACFTLGDEKISRQHRLLAILISLSFYWGEVGGLMIFPILLKLIFSKNYYSKSILRAAPLAVYMSTPAFVQKIYLFSGGNITRTLFGAAFIISTGLLLSFTLAKFEKLKFGIRNLEELVFGLGLFAAFTASALLKVGPEEGAITSATFFSFQREGLLLLATLVFLWIKRREPWAQILLVYAGIQFYWFTIWRVAVKSGLSNHFNPSNLWQNLVKDAMMFSFPLLTTVVGVIALSNWTQDKKYKKQFSFVILVFFLFLQDPLVKSVADGPLAPHAPRLSVFQSLHDLFWLPLHRGVTSSHSGNIVITGLAIKEPDMIEKLFILQKTTPKQLQICLDDKIPHPGVADFDVQAYTVEYLTGANAPKLNISNEKICDVRIVSNEGAVACSQDEKLFYTSSLLIGCVKAPLL